jgi:NADPH-dependent 2,4-dienoyl-CoA reductase/sulfur reductase-like enzyme
LSRAERIVIVGASLAGLHAAEALRDGGFTGSLTLIGEERHLPYDRPPPSKRVALGMVGHECTTLPQQRSVDARWRLNVRVIENRRAVADIELSGVVIPAGSTVVLLLAAANRDSARFPFAARFDPDRSDNQHLGFGSGVHSCFGSPLARLEGQIAPRLFFERVVHPRVVGRPRYRPSPLLRGPSELIVAYSGVRGHSDCTHHKQ